MNDCTWERSDCTHEWFIVPTERRAGEREFACLNCNMRRLEYQYAGSRAESEDQLGLSLNLPKPPSEEAFRMLTFSTENPTENGWYWYRQGNVKPMFAQIENGKVRALAMPVDTLRLELHGEWAGPLKPPEG
jgi:hypothetical protein